MSKKKEQRTKREKPGDQACRDFADTVHRPGCCRAYYDTATGPLASNCAEDGGSPAGAVHREFGGRPCDQPDQPGDQARRDSAEYVRRHGCRHACGDAPTGPSGSDCAGDGGRPAGAVHRQRERACDPAGDQACRDSADSAHRQRRRRAGGDATTFSSAADCAQDGVDDVPVPQILNEIVEVGPAQEMVPRARMSERITEQIQTSEEVVEVVKAVRNVPQKRISEKIGEQIDDDIFLVDQRGDQACRGQAMTGPSHSNFVEDGGSPAGAVRRHSCGHAFDQADQPGDQAGRVSAVSTHRRGPDQPGDQARRVSADCGDTVTCPSRSSADGPQPSSVEEQLLRMVLLMPDTRAMRESISQLSVSAEREALIKQLCGFIQRRLELAQEYAQR